MKLRFGGTKRRSGATPIQRGVPAADADDNRPRKRAYSPGATERTGEGKKGAKTHKPAGNPAALVSAYFLQHLQVFFYSLGQLSRAPFSTLMTAAVIGIALALPAGLHVLVKNIQQLSAGWDGGAQISLFLKPGIDDAQAHQLAERVRRVPGVQAVELVSRSQALDEFRQLSGFGKALDMLEENPLPAVLVVRPAGAGLSLSPFDAQAPQDGLAPTRALLERLQGLPEVEQVQADMQWLQRLYAIMATVQRAVVILGALLALAVLLIVGNTIRLAIYSRRDEIEIIKLIGAADNFIQRPFLYTGLWYGLFGGIIAWWLVSLSLWLLRAPVQQLATLYHSNFALGGLDIAGTGLLLGAGVFLGLCGSALAVKRHLAAIEPI